MALQASPATAALAGLLASAGFSLASAWQAGHAQASALSRALVWLPLVVVLVVLPGWWLVVGAGQARFEQRWFKDPAEVARFMALVNRMICWFAAAVAGAMLSAALLGAWFA